jgi:hypothetical protein
VIDARSATSGIRFVEALGARGERRIAGAWAFEIRSLSTTKASERTKQSISAFLLALLHPSNGHTAYDGAQMLLGYFQGLQDSRGLRGVKYGCVRQEKPRSACFRSHLASLQIATDTDVDFSYLVSMPRLINRGSAAPFPVLNHAESGCRAE